MTAIKRKMTATEMFDFRMRKQAQIRCIIKQAEPVSRIYRDKRFRDYYTAQFLNHPGNDTVSALRRFSKRVEVKFSRIGINGTTFINPDAYVDGYRLNVYL